MFRSIVLLEGKPSARLRFWMLWTGFSLRLSLYFGAFHFSSTPTSPCCWKTVPQHEAATAHFTFGMVLFKIYAWNWGSSDQIILFITVWWSFRCFFANSKCVFMCLHWREDWVLPHCIKLRSMECYSDVCLSADFSYLHIGSWSSTRVTIRFLVTSLTKALFHQLTYR